MIIYYAAHEAEVWTSYIRFPTVIRKNIIHIWKEWREDSANDYQIYNDRHSPMQGMLEMR